MFALDAQATASKGCPSLIVTVFFSILLYGHGRSTESWKSTYRKRNRAWGWTPSSLRPVGRGGGGSVLGISRPDVYTAVGIIPVGLNPEHIHPLSTEKLTWLKKLLPVSRTESSLVLATPSGNAIHLSKGSLPSDEFSVETLCSTCDVVIIWMEDVETLSHGGWVASLLEGAKRRQAAGLDKLQVLILFRNDTGNEDDAESALDSMASTIVLDNEIRRITPTHVDALEVVAIEDITQVERVWKDLVELSATADCPRQRLVEKEGIVRLVETVYEALSSQSWAVHLESISEDAVPPVEGESALFDEEGLIRRMFQQAAARLEQLERKQQEVWLNPGEHVPLLEFGQEANAILKQASDTLEMNTSPERRVRMIELRRDLLSRIVSGKLKLLYEQQLQSLREHYGRRYEIALDESNNQQQWTVEARIATENFRVASQEAIPELCRERQELRDAADFSYVTELQGLVSDMTAATSQREGYLDEASDDENDNGSAPTKQAPKWYQKLAARSAVLAVNYFQGWLAWQTIRRAAAERDRDMPKFPLF